MPFQMVRNDITKMECDAIVNAANSSLLGGGGVDGAIHRAAGRELLKECRKLGGCETGEAKITGAYKLPCKYVIHTVGPIWKDGRNGEEESLRACYRNSLELAVKYGCESVAFPLISAGAYGYPREQALQVAIDEIGSFLAEQDLQIYLVIFDRNSFRISQKLEREITEYIDECYVEAHYVKRSLFSGAHSLQEAPAGASGAAESRWKKDRKKPQAVSMQAPSPSAVLETEGAWSPELKDVVSQVDESFSQMLLRKIDEKGMTDAECYKKANIDRKLFSKIRSDVQYKPSKPTALAFAVALELPPEETRELLMKAGYALSHSNKFDIIVEFFINRRNYNIFEINEALFAFDQSLLGAR